MFDSKKYQRNRYKIDEGFRKIMIKNSINWQKRNKEKTNAKSRRWYNKTKGMLFNTMLDHYGHKCNCEKCPETNEKFLTLDHINNDGKIHHEKVGHTVPVYKDVIKRGFPSTFQILCMNCNWAKSRFGICPHKDLN